MDGRKGNSVPCHDMAARWQKNAAQKNDGSSDGEVD